MKKLLLLTLISSFSFGQSGWKIEKIKSTFDGDESVIYVVGYNGSYPYNTPLVGMNRSNVLTINDFGYISSGDDSVLVKVAFDKNPETIKSFLFKRSDSNIIRYNELDVLELVDGFNKYNLAEFRIYSDRGETYEFSISLSGFTKVYNQLIPNGITKVRQLVSLLNKRKAEIEKTKAEKSKRENESIDLMDNEWKTFFKDTLFVKLIELHKRYPDLKTQDIDIYRFDWKWKQQEMYINNVKPDLLDVETLGFSRRGAWVDLVHLSGNDIPDTIWIKKSYRLNTNNNVK